MFSAVGKPWFIVPDADTCLLKRCSDPASLHAFKLLSRQARHQCVMHKRDQFYKVLAPKRDGTSDFILSRIGSPSAFGEVYHVCVDGAHVACKVMPVYSPAFLHKNMQEVTKAQLVSQLVSLKICPYFPMVYMVNNNVSVQLDPSSNAAQSGRYAASKEKVLELLSNNPATPAMVKRLLSRPATRERLLATDVKSHAELLTLIQTYAGGAERISPEYVMTLIDDAYEQTSSFSATLMYSEFADGDLSAVLLRNNIPKLPPALQEASYTLRYNVSAFARLCSQLVEAIEALQEHAGMVHNDLHFANVLVMWHRNQLVPLIHDFGESRVIVLPELLQKDARASVTTSDTSADGTFTTTQRLYDLQMLFVDKMLSFATDASPELELSDECISLLTRMKGVIDSYRAAERTDAGIFGELQQVLSSGETSTSRKRGRRTIQLQGGYASSELGMIALA